MRLARALRLCIAASDRAETREEVDHAEGSQLAPTVLMLGLAIKLTLRVSRGSVMLSSYTQAQRSCSMYLRVQHRPRKAASTCAL
jgi:hypothetical protein